MLHMHDIVVKTALQCETSFESALARSAAMRRSATRMSSSQDACRRSAVKWTHICQGVPEQSLPNEVRTDVGRSMDSLQSDLL
jgi:hypothetical protein